MSDAQKQFEYWLNDPYFDQETKNELLAIRNDEAEVEDRFYRELEFGTGGLRGVIGAGTNRMNVYTVARATQGLTRWIQEKKGSGRVALSYDSRINSERFARTAAEAARSSRTNARSAAAQDMSLIQRPSRYLFLPESTTDRASASATRESPA